MSTNVQTIARPPAARHDASCRRKRRLARDQVDVWLLRAVDAGLAGTIFVVPLVMGGRQAVGQLALIGMAVWAAGCWCLRQARSSQATWTRSAAEPVLFAALFLVSLQLMALPPAFLRGASPHLFEMLPLWAPQTDVTEPTLGVWNTLSLTPPATRDALVVLVAYTLLFLTVVQRVRRLEDIERLVRWIALAVLGMAAFGLVQYLGGNGKFFWFHEHPFTTTRHAAKGSFTNSNHFAHFLALGIGPIVWWIQKTLRPTRDGEKFPRHRSAWPHERTEGFDTRAGLLIVALTVCAFAALMSLSRGGMVAMMVAGVVCIFLLHRGGLIGGKMALGLGSIGLLIISGLWIYGYDMVAAELDDFAAIEELDRDEGRRRLWKADARGIADFPLLGTGIGSHCDVHPRYFHDPLLAGRIEFTHAESGYVQVPLEAGMAGLAVLLAGMGLCGYWSVCLLRRNLSNRMLLCLLAILPALVVSAVHSAFDYVWYVPGCMVLVVMLAACLCRLWHLERERAGAPTKSMAISRYGWLGMTACLGVVGFFLFQDSVSGALAEPDWHRYLRVRQEAWHLEGAEQREAYESMLEALNATVAKKPDFARAHSRLAAAHLALFDLPEDPSVNPLSLAHIRQAAEASRFDSSEALNTWLARAVGSRLEHLNAARKHARRAVALGPLQGEAYLYLAELAFLDGPHFPSRAAYVDQAARVRPFDGDVLFEQGREALFAGRPDEAMHFWKEAFRAGRIHQKHMVRMLAERLPAAVFLEVFEHDLFTLRLLESRYRGLERPDETELVTRRLAQQAEEEALADESETAAQHWLQAALAYQRLHESEEAIRCLRRAVGCDAYNYDLRYRLGACLCENQRYEEAEEHLNWCLQRKPDNGKLKALMAEAVDGRLRRAPRQHGD